jgi:hypothetical protein
MSKETSIDNPLDAPEPRIPVIIDFAGNRIEEGDHFLYTIEHPKGAFPMMTIGKVLKLHPFTGTNQWLAEADVEIVRTQRPEMVVGEVYRVVTPVRTNEISAQSNWIKVVPAATG